MYELPQEIELIQNIMKQDTMFRVKARDFKIPPSGKS